MDKKIFKRVADRIAKRLPVTSVYEIEKEFGGYFVNIYRLDNGKFLLAFDTSDIAELMQEHDLHEVSLQNYIDDNGLDDIRDVDRIASETAAVEIGGQAIIQPFEDFAAGRLMRKFVEQPTD